MSRNALLNLALAAVAATAISCSKAKDVECQPGYSLCGGVCVRVGADPQNCGACGNVCGPTQTCVAAACVTDCRSSLHAPIDDPWGTSWDGLERSPGSYLDARAACEEFGGRLPTASEIVRAGVKTAAVGDGYQTSLLWSLAPIDAATALAVRLSNGTSAQLAFAPAPGAQSNYRCVCPPARPAAFTGSACFSTKLGDGCAPMPGNPAFNFDGEDRTLLPRSAAMYECALAGGELSTVAQLAPAFLGGLSSPSSAPGSGVWLHTGDAVSNPGMDALALSSNAPTFGAAAGPLTFYGFRCVGPAAKGVAATVANGFRAPRGDRVMDADPDHAATTYAVALFDCLGRGGHLPTGNELATFAIQGLPGGTGGARWTSDQTSTTQVETFAWSGTAYWPVDPDLAATSPTANGVSFDVVSAGRADKTGALPYRCIYYGVNPAYAPPSATACGGTSCLLVPVGTRARMWFMRSPRGGSGGDTFSSAAKYCADLGGRLPSVRDYVEAIHAGLENVSAAALTTSDFVSMGGDVRTLSWSGTFPADADPSPATVAATAGSVKYVCMWTDELR